VLIDYNRSIVPPAPFVPIAVSHPDNPNAPDTISAAKLDSGADITALPASLVKSLALPERNLVEVAGYDNQSVTIATYFAVIEVAHIRVNAEVIAVSEDYALLGRDVLNLLRLLLDGPALTLEILPPAEVEVPSVP
jgi:predicted aspartyl protease